MLYMKILLIRRKVNLISSNQFFFSLYNQYALPTASSSKQCIFNLMAPVTLVNDRKFSDTGTYLPTQLQL